MSDKNRGNVSAIDDYIDEETIEILEHLLVEARNGSIVGLGFVSAGKNTLAEVGITGSCRTDPILTLGFVRMLEDLAADFAHDTEVPPPNAV